MSVSSINRVILIGNLTRDPELRTVGQGETSVCHLRVACNGRRKTSSGWVDRSHYFDVTVFGASAANCDRYLRRGRPVAIDGRLEWREWTEEETRKKRQAVSIVAESVQFLGTPDRKQPDSDGEGAEGSAEGVVEPEDAAGPEPGSDETGVEEGAIDADDTDLAPVGVGADGLDTDPDERADISF